MKFDLASCGDIGDIPSMTLPKLIPVSGGNFALVDESDYDHILEFSWQFANGYARRHMSNSECDKLGVKRKSSTTMHRQILGIPMEFDIDHWNNNGLDNRRQNLRQCTVSQNLAFARKKLFAKPDRITTSRFKGVSWRKDRQRWTAFCGTGKRRVALGCFPSEEAAALAYNEEAIKMWGEFARINELNDGV